VFYLLTGLTGKYSCIFRDAAYISDFGLSQYVGRDFENFGRVSASTSPHGAARWRAPEMHYPEKFGLTLADAQATPSDTWSFGMTVLVMFIMFILPHACQFLV